MCWIWTIIWHCNVWKCIKCYKTSLVNVQTDDDDDNKFGNVNPKIGNVNGFTDITSLLNIRFGEIFSERDWVNTFVHMVLE